jgi:mono/diheme cytochrome c family protein
MKRYLTLSSITFALACGGSQLPPPEEAPGASEMEAPSEESSATSPPQPEGPAPQTFAEQVALGQELFGANCAKCHGDSGQGGEHAPPLVGLKTGALPLDPPATAKQRTTQFRTVADVAQFTVANMPPKKAGSLTEEQYWAILAFDLKANGIELDQKLDPTLAATLELPR